MHWIIITAFHLFSVRLILILKAYWVISNGAANSCTSISQKRWCSLMSSNGWSQWSGASMNCIRRLKLCIQTRTLIPIRWPGTAEKLNLPYLNGKCFARTRISKNNNPRQLLPGYTDPIFANIIGQPAPPGSGNNNGHPPSNCFSAEIWCF